MPLGDMDSPSPRSIEARRGSSAGRLVTISVAGLVLLGAVSIVTAAWWRQGGTKLEPPTIPTVGVLVPTLEVASPLPAEPTEPAGPIEPTKSVEEGDGAPSASFEFHRTAPAYGESFYVLGIVTNTSQIPIGKPELIVVFLDAHGNEVGTDHGYALADAMEPGNRSYLSAIVSNPPAHAKLRFEVVARKASYSLPPAEGLRVAAQVPRADGLLTRFWGQVHNDGPKPSSFTQVQVVSFDAEDKLLGIHFGYVQGEALAPGASARFDVSAVGVSTATRHEYLVTGSVR
jgi:hypothetical protein